MSVLNLPKQYMHSGVVMGPGDVDVHKVMKANGHDEAWQNRTFDDLSQRVKEFIAAGSPNDTAPISHEIDLKPDGAVTAVNQATNKGTDPDTTQKAPAAAVQPKTVAK